MGTPIGQSTERVGTRGSMERSRRKSSKQALEEKQMKRYFRAKKRSRQRDRSSSAYCQKEETTATPKDAEGATGRCNKESQQLIRKESQQHRASVNKVECKQIDITNNSAESKDSEEQAEKHAGEAKSIGSESVAKNLNFAQETKESIEYQENDKLEPEEDKESKSSSENNQDHEIIGSADEKSEDLISNSDDHLSDKDKKPKFTYEIIEEIVQRTEVTYFVTKRDHREDNGAAGRLMNMTPKNITSQQKECSLGSSSCASDEGVDMREDELTVFSGNHHLEGNCLLVH